MATQKQVKTKSEQSTDLEESEKLRGFTPTHQRLGKPRLENVIRALKSGTRQGTAAPVGKPRAGSVRRQGKVSELTVIAPLAQAEQRMRAFLEILTQHWQ